MIFIVKDVLMDGNGAPLVPIGDELFFISLMLTLANGFVIFKTKKMLWSQFFAEKLGKIMMKMEFRQKEET